MAKLSISVIALALLAACGGQERVTPAPAPVVITPAPAATPPAPTTTVVVPPSSSGPVIVPAATTVRAGVGRVESIAAAPPSAAAGGAAMRRLGIKMEDGTVQFVDTVAQGISIGDRLELTSDGYIKR